MRARRLLMPFRLVVVLTMSWHLLSPFLTVRGI